MILKIGSYVYVILHISFVLLLIGDILYTGVIVPPLRTYVPGIDETSIGGMAFLIVFNYLVLLAGYYITGCYDTMLFIIIANMQIVSSVIIGHLNELKEALLVPKRRSCEIERKLLRIILIHRQYKE